MKGQRLLHHGKVAEQLKTLERTCTMLVLTKGCASSEKAQVMIMLETPEIQRCEVPIQRFRCEIKSHTTDSRRLPDLLVRVCGVVVQLPGSRRLCWAWCPSCPDQRWLLVAWGSQIGGNATIPYKSLTKAHLDIHLDESNYNIRFVKIKRMTNRQDSHSFPNIKLALLPGV